MRILVAGTGRSGTCLLVEVPRGLNIVKFSASMEDRNWFGYEELPENYGTKLTTEHKTFTMERVISYMKKYKDLHIIFSLRHPLDIFLSKIRRGQKASDGGDRSRERIADDATPLAAIETIKDFYEKYIKLNKLFPARAMSVKLEDLIISPRIIVEAVAKYFNIEPTKEAYEFSSRDRNAYHKKRYRGEINKGQIAMYKRWDSIYDGFFKEKKQMIELANFELANIIQDLGYEQYMSKED